MLGSELKKMQKFTELASWLLPVFGPLINLSIDEMLSHYPDIFLQ